MKISPVSSPSGAPGQILGAAEVGRTANPMKMERARAIARGESVPEQAPAQQSERSQNNVRSIKMNTQRSTNREESPTANVVSDLSSIPESNEQATVEATQPLSPQFAALAKEKRAAQVMKAEAQKLMEEVKAMQAGAADSIPRSRLKTDSLGVLQELGILDDSNFYNALTERILGNQNGINPELQALKAEVKALKEGVNQTFTSKEEQAEESALTEMLYEAENLAKEGDAFEMIRERDAYDRVLRRIYDNYKKTGRVLDVNVVMQSVENELLEEAEKFARIKKVQSRISPLQSPQLQQQPQKQMRTLTARDSANSSLSARARAIAAFNGTLRK